MPPPTKSISLKLKQFLINYLLVHIICKLYDKKPCISTFSSYIKYKFFKLVAQYSAILEPNVNKLQGVNFNLHIVHRYIKTDHLEILKKHRENTGDYFKDIFEDITNTAKHFNIIYLTYHKKLDAKVIVQIIIFQLLKIIITVCPYSYHI